MEARSAVIMFVRDIEKAVSQLAERLENLEASPPISVGEEIEIPTARGKRQQEVLKILQETFSDEGRKTRELADEIEMDQANAYLTLQALSRQGKVEMVPASDPQRWRLAAKYRAWRRVVQAAQHIPEGRWITYGDLAVVVYGNLGAARTVGQAATQIENLPYPHRILAKGGKVPEGWQDGPGQGRDECISRLVHEGSWLVDKDCADPARRIGAEELRDLMGEEPS